MHARGAIIAGWQSKTAKPSAVAGGAKKIAEILVENTAVGEAGLAAHVESDLQSVE